MQIPNKKLPIKTIIIVEEKASDILNITLDSMLHVDVIGNICNGFGLLLPYIPQLPAYSLGLSCWIM
jgi:hypothetical protein